MFADIATAVRVEAAEARVTREIVTPLVGSQRAPGAFVRDVDGGGVAAFVRPGAPMNKIIGVGLPAPAGDHILELERLYHAHDEPVRVELATLAAPGTAEQLTARGYRLLGFENVLGCPLAGRAAPSPTDIAIERVDVTPEFRAAMIDGASVSDDTGAVVDQFTRDVIATAMDDALVSTGFARYLARRDGAVAGAASMCVFDNVAMLTGSATLPAHRRRGVQAALLQRRLADARAAGATLAVITTGPGTQSQANVMKQGFALLYARAVLVRPIA